MESVCNRKLRRLSLPGEASVRHSSSVGPKDSFTLPSTIIQTGPAEERARTNTSFCFVKPDCLLAEAP